MKPPTGGDKDVEPPVVIETDPMNFSTEFAAQRIVIEFDEFVQLRNLSAQLVINPSMEERPDFRLRGKKLLIDLSSPLQEETTYVINFGDAVVDLNEGNALSGLQYVFSTGSFLDSLQFQGRVIDAFEKKPVADALVMLYSNHSDTMIYKGRPDYFGKTDQRGEYNINYIRPGEYRVFALLDENSNYQYDPPTERVGFLDSLVVPGAPDTMNVSHQILLFSEKDSTQYIDVRNESFYGQLQLILYQPADTADIEPLDDQYTLITEHGVVGDTITAWFPNRSEYPEMEVMNVVVSASPDFQDTLRWNLNRRKDDPDPLMVIKDNLLFNFNPYQPMRFTFNHPIDRVDTTQIELYRDSVLLEYEWKSTDSPRRFELHHPWEPGESYRVFAPDSTFWDIFQLTNDTLDKEVNMREDRYFGNLQFDLTFDESQPIILQLLNDRGDLVKEVIPESSGVLEFERMSPGTYSMRVITDLNENGEWDTGNVDEQRQPEPVEVYDQSIQIRSNWDLELSWDLTEE